VGEGVVQVDSLSSAQHSSPPCVMQVLRDRRSACNMARFASQTSRAILLLCILATAGHSNALGSKKKIFTEEALG
jgi:hypothetical protein